MSIPWFSRQGLVLIDDGVVRAHVYATVKACGVPPTIQQLAALTGGDTDRVRESLQRLAASRVLVLQAGGEILMAPPFSAVPTPFVVETAAHTSYANCAWDAFGVPITLRQRAHVTTSCSCCGGAMSFDVAPDEPPAVDGVMHFAVPAARWWDDLVFT